MLEAASKRLTRAVEEVDGEDAVLDGKITISRSGTEMRVSTYEPTGKCWRRLTSTDSPS